MTALLEPAIDAAVDTDDRDTGAFGVSQGAQSRFLYKRKMTDQVTDY